MKTFASTISASVIAAAVLLSGCGSTSDTSSATDITVERGPLLYATVTDAGGQQAQMRGYGVYRFDEAPLYPVTSTGGVIDVNRNNIIDAGDINATRLRLQTMQGDAATVVTTIAADAAIRTMLQQEYNLSETQIFNETPSSDMRIAAISDEVYKYSVENNISDPAQLTLQVMESLRIQIAARIEAYEDSNLSAGALEQAMVQSELSLQVMTQEQAQIMTALMQNRDDNQSATQDMNQTASQDMNQTASQDANQSTLQDGSCVGDCNATALSELTSEQEYVLAYMWNEEKMAKDLYLALNDVWPNAVLFNIATRAETLHQATVESMIETYDLNILDLESDSGYSAEALAAYGAGEYAVAAVQELYDALYAEGAASAQAALEVGCKVEVTDVNDLDRDIVTAEGADDLVAMLEGLRSGSYNHYWAFDGALKTMGVSDGCCSLGDAFCKTPEEYPSTQGMGNGTL